MNLKPKYCYNNDVYMIPNIVLRFEHILIYIHVSIDLPNTTHVLVPLSHLQSLPAQLAPQAAQLAAVPLEHLTSSENNNWEIQKNESLIFPI